jgi:hypothetical protein
VVTSNNLWFNGLMTTEHRKAPRRFIEEIERIGGWGKVKYHHHLACGHIEIRDRASTAPKLGCAWCFRASQRDAELKNPMAGGTIIPSAIDSGATMGQDEIDIERTRAALATALSVPADAIDLIAIDADGSLEIQNALVFLSAHDVMRLANRKA